MPNSIVHRSQRCFVRSAQAFLLCLMLLSVYALEAHVMRSRRRQIPPMGAIKSIHLSCIAKAWYNSIKGLIKWQTLLFNGRALPLEDCRSPDCVLKRNILLNWQDKAGLVYRGALAAFYSSHLLSNVQTSVVVAVTISQIPPPTTTTTAAAATEKAPDVTMPQ